MLIENIIPERGASLIVGAAKSNKTLLAVQMGIAVASGTPFLDNYRVLQSGPVLILEQDDPAGAASIKDILKRSPVPVAGIPFRMVERVPFSFGLALLGWLEKQIRTLKLCLVVLDSYTALRGSRGSGVDIVKAEQHDLNMLDELAKRTECAIVIIHHASKGSAALDWSDQAAGTFAMSAATESQMHVSRYRELDGNAPERLIRVRGRHQEGLEMVVRFRKDTLDHEHVLEGGAAPLYPLVLQLQSAFGTQPFGPKEFMRATGVSPATAHRQIDKLCRANVLMKRGYGEYVLSGVRQ
jgi:RecA-family ATPase